MVLFCRSTTTASFAKYCSRNDGMGSIRKSANMTTFAKAFLTTMKWNYLHDGLMPH